jgi:CO dehydrogenase maturation factor
MPYTIAVAGKGGTGKTTLCGFLIDWLVKQGRKPVLAVDADANSNLNEVLGVEAPVSLGEIREEIAHAEDSGAVPSGMSKQDYMEFRFNAALEEEDDFDMLVMGRTQGKGCYCFVNGLLQTQLQKFSGSYKYVVVDNEAGMEHISRGLLPAVDVLLLVSDCSRRGIQAVGRIAELAKELGLKPRYMKLIVNRAPSKELSPGIREEIDRQGLELLGVIPQDENIYEFDSDGKPTASLPSDSPARAAFEPLLPGIMD